MTPLLLSMLLGAEVLSPPIPVQAASGAAVQVAAEPGTIDVTLANRSAVAVWADQRRVQGLLTSTQVVTPVADLWVRVLDGGTAPRPVCFEHSPALAVRATSTSTGRVGIAWRRGVAGELALSVMDANRQFEADPCGRLVDTATSGRPAVVAVGESFRLAWETDAGVFGIVRALDGGGVLTPPRALFPSGCVQPVLADTPDGSYAGALCAGGAIALRNGSAVEPVTAELATAFTLVPELDGPVLLRVDGMGQVWFHFVAAQSAVMKVQSVPGREPLAVAANESVLSALESGGSTQVLNQGRMGSAQGVPVALAATASAGLVATQLDSGVVRGSELRVTPATMAILAPESISTARVLQRRPSVAWWDEAQRWLLTWEEATAPNTWTPRGAVIGGPGVQRPFAMPTALVWPRVLRQPDGGLRLYGRENLQTLVYTPMPDGGFSAPDTVPFVVRGGVAGETHTYWWSDTLGLLHREYVDGLMSAGLTSSGDVEVSCAAWSEGRDGGEFVVARALATSAGIGRFSEGVSPDANNQMLSAPRACVSARPGSSQLALLVSRPGALQLTRSTDAGLLLSTVSADAGAWGLQLAPTSTGWLVAYNSDAGVFAVSVDDEPSSSPRYYRLDTTGVAHGDPSVAAAPTGAVAVTWASLIGDSVELRMRIFEPAVTDGGVDAGEVDAGEVDAGEVDAGSDVDAGFDGGSRDGGADAGVFDAGAVDAGQGDAGTMMADGGPALTFVPVCGCGASDDASVLLALVFVLAWCGMRRRG